MQPFNVLFLQSDPLTADVRIRPLLDLLRSSGQISGYAVVDRDMALSGDRADRYDVVLAHRNPSKRQATWLQRTTSVFAYDLDDLLLEGAAAGLRPRQAAEERSIAWCLANAHRVTGPSRRLLATLERRAGMAFGSRAVFLPNSGAERPPPAKASGKPRLLWVSSAAMPIVDDILAACAGIGAAARALDTDVVLVGRFAPEILARIGRHEHIPWISPDQYRSWLAAGPFVAAVPLPACRPADEQDFFDCKSDVKAAEYGSNRVAAVYSPVPPYTESDLPCVIAPANTAADWEAALVALARSFPTSGNDLADHTAFVKRRPSVIARQLLTVLTDVQRATKQPASFRAVPTPTIFRGIERGFRTLRSHFRHRWR